MFLYANSIYELIKIFQAIGSSLASKLEVVQNEIEMARIEKETFRRMAEHEAKAVTKRVSKLREEVKKQEEREKELQKIYSDYKGNQLSFFFNLSHISSDREWRIQQHELRKDATVKADAVNY